MVLLGHYKKNYFSFWNLETYVKKKISLVCLKIEQHKDGPSENSDQSLSVFKEESDRNDCNYLINSVKDLAKNPNGVK